MAEKNENSLIGYDPLAWMSDQVRQPPVSEFAEDEIEIRSEVSAAVPEPGDFPEEATAFIPAVDVDRTRQQNTADGHAIIELASVLNIQNVAKLHACLLEALDNNSKIEIDASAVTIADTASLQLLLILKRTAIQQQKQVWIDFPSEKFIQAAELLGISAMLEVDHAAAGLF